MCYVGQIVLLKYTDNNNNIVEIIGHFHEEGGAKAVIAWHQMLIVWYERIVGMFNAKLQWISYTFGQNDWALAMVLGMFPPTLQWHN